MGTFDYICKSCGLKFEHTALNESDIARCVCGCTDLIRLFPLTKAVGIGQESVCVESENYIRPDKPPNPAKKWRKFARICENLETEGKIPKVDDHVELSIKSWQKAGYEV